MIACDPDRLEQLVLGELSVAEGEELTSHAQTCAECGAELTMLRSERDVFAARASALASVVPVATAAPPKRVPMLRRAARGPWVAAAGMVLALAAAILFYVRRPSIVAPREPAVAAAIAADPAAQEMCEDDGFVHERRGESSLRCEEPTRDSGVTNDCRSPLSP